MLRTREATTRFIKSSFQNELNSRDLRCILLSKRNLRIYLQKVLKQWEQKTFSMIHFDGLFRYKYFSTAQSPIKTVSHSIVDGFSCFLLPFQRGINIYLVCYCTEKGCKTVFIKLSIYHRDVGGKIYNIEIIIESREWKHRKHSSLISILTFTSVGGESCGRLNSKTINDDVWDASFTSTWSVQSK
jgi:hypothetical protein